MKSPARLRVLVVDDEPRASAGVRKLVDRDPELECAGECHSGSAAVDAIRAGHADIVLLDVEMPELDGFGVVASVGVDRMPVTVFVTAYDQYALRAFRVSAVDYLTKPFDDEAFAATIGRAKRAARDRVSGATADRLLTLLESLQSSVGATPPASYLDRIAVKADGRTVLLGVDTVDWIEAADYYVKLHTGAVTRLMRTTLGDLEARLDPSRFFRLHRSAIVNLDRVRELRPSFRGEHVVLLQDGTRLRLPRRRRPQLAAVLKQHL